MNRLLASAVVREALDDGSHVAVLLGSPRDVTVFFREVEKCVRDLAAESPDFVADVVGTSGAESFTFPGAGRIMFALARRSTIPADSDLVYVDRESVEAVIQDQREFEMAMFDVQTFCPGAEIVYSSSDR